MSILADIFMLLSCPGCHGIQCFKLFDINLKKKGLARHIFATQLHWVCTSVQYSHIFFPSKQIHLSKKNKAGQKLYDRNVRALYGCGKSDRPYKLTKKRKILQANCNSVALLVCFYSHTISMIPVIFLIL